MGYNGDKILTLIIEIIRSATITAPENGIITIPITIKLSQSMLGTAEAMLMALTEAGNRAPLKIPSLFGTRESEIINTIIVSTNNSLPLTRKLKNYQPGFFDLEIRANQLTDMGAPRVALQRQIDWEAFRIELERVHEKRRRSNAGAKPIEVVLLFQLLVLQHLYKLSDEALEYQVRDRLSCLRFLGLQLAARVPAAKTVWWFRERLTERGLVEKLLERVREQVEAHGYVARRGPLIEATLVEVPRQRHTREEHAPIKAGEPPAGWKPAKARQPDVDARWAKNNEESHSGYKNHIIAFLT